MERKQVDWVSFGASLATIALVCLPLVVFPQSGGEQLLETRLVQTAAIVPSFPLLGVGVLMAYSLVKQLGDDHPA